MIKHVTPSQIIFFVKSIVDQFAHFYDRSEFKSSSLLIDLDLVKDKIIDGITGNSLHIENVPFWKFLKNPFSNGNGNLKSKFGLWNQSDINLK